LFNTAAAAAATQAWLQHECWSRQLQYDGLKPELVQQLLQWQETEAGQEAAAVALANAESARAAAAAAAAGDEGLQEQQGDAQQLDSIDSSSGSSSGSRRRRRSTNSAAVASNSSITGEGQVFGDGVDDAADVASFEKPLRNAAAAAADSLTALLLQLQEQPDNAALLAVARNSLELHVRGLMTNTHTSESSSSRLNSGSWQSFTSSRGWGSAAAAAASASAAAAASRTAALQEAAADLAFRIQTASSPASIAALATACYSREVQSPVLAAAMSEAVASVAPQLGPQEVYRVLRLLVEHLGQPNVTNSVSNGDGLAAGGEAGTTLRRGFQVLAQALIGCCSALAPMQLAEAVALLARHQYDDAWGCVAAYQLYSWLLLAFF
jgi:hypothetical protein